MLALCSNKVLNRPVIVRKSVFQLLEAPNPMKIYLRVCSLLLVQRELAPFPVDLVLPYQKLKKLS